MVGMEERDGRGHRQRDGGGGETAYRTMLGGGGARELGNYRNHKGDRTMGEGRQSKPEARAKLHLDPRKPTLR